ncbi:PEGA domain-containing protein [Candidatus Uhrbacteria bacterium]|nr:PEGA domain-containing protein [Candidatus Uhrbacteria bacterium]
MSKSFRFILFLLFVFAFLISAPLLVLYTAGYRFDLAHGRIVHTAVLSVTSTPRNATVLIDASTNSDRTPAVIETILPGEHLVSLEKTGYLPWETHLEFKSREARVIGPITLFLDTQPELQEVLPGSILTPHPPTNRFAYVTQESSWLEVWLVDITKEEKRLLMRLPYDARNQHNLTWSKDGGYLLLSETHGTQSDLHVTRVSDGFALELPEEAEQVQSYWWDLENEEILYTDSLRGITRIAVHSGTVELIPVEAKLVTTYKDQRIILSESNNRSVVSSYIGGTASIITYLPLGAYQLVEAPSGILGLQDVQHSRLILIDLSNQDQPILLNEEARLWKWNSDNNTLLYSTGYDLKRYIRSIHENQTITRLSKSITALDWYPASSTILYQSDGIIESLNIDNTTILSQTTLSQGITGFFWIDQNGQNLHLLEKNGETWNWWTRELQK